MPRAKQRTPQLREHVLQVAIAMLESDGVAAFTARRIAEQSATSLPAVYELFGAKAGLVREVFFEGFRMLRRRFDELEQRADTRAAVVDMLEAFRSFAAQNPVLTGVMFSRPFADFEPGGEERKAGSAVREFFVRRVRLWLRGVCSSSDETDVAHVLLALVQGLAAQESAGLLGSSRASVERRWNLAVRAALDGLAVSPSQITSARRRAPAVATRSAQSSRKAR